MHSACVATAKVQMTRCCLGNGAAAYLLFVASAGCMPANFITQHSLEQQYDSVAALPLTVISCASLGWVMRAGCQYLPMALSPARS